MAATSSMYSSSSSSSDQTMIARTHGLPKDSPVMKQTINISPSVHFPTPIQQKNFMELAQRCSEAVCQIQTPYSEERGSGFLIGGNLLITNNHVLKDKETARKSCACFFRVVSQDPLKQETNVQIIRIDLDPDACFYSSPSNQDRWGEVQPADEEHLDYTVVALKLHPHLSTLQDKVLSIFDAIDPTPNSAVSVLQYPDFIDSTTGLKGDLRLSYGSVTEIGPWTASYDAPTSGGSSGGAVINSEGKLVALHYQSTQRQTGSTVHVESNSGVLFSRIAPKLLEHQVELDKCLQIELPTAPMNRKIINLPAPKTAFTGRDKELGKLHEFCSNGGRVAIIGLGGIGKTTLAIHYANLHQTVHSLICFIPSTTSSQIQIGLLNLADELGIPDVSPIERRLLLLKTRLEERDSPALVILDGVDDEAALSYLQDYLPQRGCVSLLLSSRLKSSTQSANFTNLDLQSFSLEEAVEFLLKSVEGKDLDQTQAALLATKLGCLPLALTHAAAYIKLTHGCTFQAYNEELADGLDILDPLYNRGEQTVLTTWKKSIEAIKAKCQSTLPEEILQFLSVLGNAAIPMDLVLKRFSSVRRLQRDLALRELGNYCLLECFVDRCSIHPLLQKVICHHLGETKRGYILQALEIYANISKKHDPRVYSDRRSLEAYIPHFESIIEIPITQEIIHPSLYPVFDIVWGYHCSDGRFEKSQHIATAHLRICKPESLEKAEALEHLGISLCELGNYKEAYEKLNEALTIRQKASNELQNLPPEDESTKRSNLLVVTSLNNLAITQLFLNHFDEAFENQEKALNLAKEVLQAKESSHIAILLSNRGCILRLLGKWEEAIKCHEEALEIRRRTLGEGHRHTAISLDNLGMAMVQHQIASSNSVTNHEKALKYLKQALAIRESITDMLHPSVAESCSNIGYAFYCSKMFEQALEYQQKAWDIRNKLFGKKHPDTITSQNDLKRTKASLCPSESNREDNAISSDNLRQGSGALFVSSATMLSLLPERDK